MVARMLMKPKLAKSHEKRMVRHRKVPNLAKNCRLQAKSGSDACRITHTRASSQCRGVACRRVPSPGSPFPWQACEQKEAAPYQD